MRSACTAHAAALPAYLRDCTRFAYLTGWRTGKIISLQRTEVDRDAGAIRLQPEAAKTGRGRTVMLDGELAELIDRRWQIRPFEQDRNVRVAALMFHRDGEPVGDFRKAWATACQAAGVPDKLVHDFRRMAARNMVCAGVPERVAMAVTGHLTRSMFARYNIVSEDDLRMATQKATMYLDTLEGLRPGPPWHSGAGTDAHGRPSGVDDENRLSRQNPFNEPAPRARCPHRRQPPAGPESVGGSRGWRSRSQTRGPQRSGGRRTAAGVPRGVSR